MIDYLNYGKQVKSVPKEPQSKITACVPSSPIWWLEYKLNQTELDYVWSCVNHQEVKRNDWTHHLVGNIDSSFKLEDKNNWFFNNTLTNLIDQYKRSFTTNWEKFKISSDDKKFLSYGMQTWWVNYQKQYEFNPSHNHDGIYSFVIWLKIPYDWEEQNKDNKSKLKMKGSFCFNYNNILGENSFSHYQLGKEHEGTMLFFPSTLSHEVFPFYNCKEDRISVSGNISIKV